MGISFSLYRAGVYRHTLSSKAQKKFSVWVLEKAATENHGDVAQLVRAQHS
jgi:predicted double-glycine peptidase